MKKYRVHGTTVVSVYCDVEAEDEESAIEAAYDELQYLAGYCGNGGTDKLIGVCGDGNSVEASDSIEWNEAEELSEPC